MRNRASERRKAARPTLDAQQRLAAAKEVFERNGLEAFGKPADPKTAIYQPPTQQTQVNVSTYHFEKLSEDELDFAERIFRSVIEGDIIQKRSSVIRDSTPLILSFLQEQKADARP